MKDGFLRVATASVAVRPTDCNYNISQILAAIRQAPANTALLVFPELCLTGSTCGDLFLQPTLHRAARQTLQYLLRETVGVNTVLVVGLPVATENAVYNCAAVCKNGQLLGFVPKHIGGCAKEQTRWFSNALPNINTITFAGHPIPFGEQLLFRCSSLPAFSLKIELGNCLDTVSDNSNATVVAALSAEPETVGSHRFRLDAARIYSARLCSAYLYANAGEGESCSDHVFAGQRLICENGTVLEQSEPFSCGLTATEVDLDLLAVARRNKQRAWDCDGENTVWFDLPVNPLRLTRRFSPTPFVPEDREELEMRCEEILRIQSAALAHRLRHTSSNAVLGLSGGLDSALALLVTARAYCLLGREPRDILSVTMPCFGTTERTLSNACLLAKSIGTSLKKVDITAAVQQHFSDIGHSGAHDITYQNAQARERTQVLMDLANQNGSLVIGTGDLSELALGWATYNGDHMSMYGVNASIPKTLVRHLVQYEADRLGGDVKTALRDILDTPVSPELLPAQDGNISQKTEELVGPYQLHDFFLYYFLRCGYAPPKLLRLAMQAFLDVYDRETVLQWLRVFCSRFFAQQFKRNCLPDGPQVGSVSLSPRGGWSMPSDAAAAAWLQSLNKI